jgi:5-formyltetrahydrofolate cyclo-ligase
LLTALATRGHPLCLPAVEAADAPLCFRAWAPGDALVAGYQDIPEPVPTVPVCTPVVLLVPLLAFDAVGHRLGYGGGFYDRTLAALRAGGPVQAIGIAYAAQAVDSLPGTDHDQRLNAVLTEQGVTRFEGVDRA